MPGPYLVRLPKYDRGRIAHWNIVGTRHVFLMLPIATVDVLLLIAGGCNRRAKEDRRGFCKIGVVNILIVIGDLISSV